MKVAVIGSRNFDNYTQLYQSLNFLMPGITEIVSGGARGADSLAVRYASEKGIRMTEFLPDYNKHGRAAPHIRNNQIVEYCDKLIAFWDGSSPGTKSVIAKAEKAGKLLKIIRAQM